jgi:carbonic anhydrase
MNYRLLILALVLALPSCAVVSKRSPSQEEHDMRVILKGKKKDAPAVGAEGGPKVVDGKEVTPVTLAADETHAEAQEMKEAVAAAAQHIHDTHPTTSEAQAPAAPVVTDATPASSGRQVGSVPAEKALGWLKNGNTRFVKGRFRADGASAKDRLRLLQGQKPHAVIFASSDSRVSPEVIFDQKLGEVFVIRTLGLSTGGNVLSSVEYAVQDLGANLVVILGHTQSKEDDSWVALEKISTNLQERSAVLRDAVGTGGVKIQRALYQLESGKVDWQ